MKKKEMEKKKTERQKLINSSNQSEWLNFNQLTMQLNLMDVYMRVKDNCVGEE